MKGEIPKLQKILERRSECIEYLLITNIPGTAFPEFGSIDTLNGLLETNLPIPVRAWWRDDLDRRCEASADIRWAYPDILRGVDLLQSLANSGGQDLDTRRLDVLKSFAVYQYDLDNEVRFKQVELSNEILSLFVDVPAIFPLGKYEGHRRNDGKPGEVRRAVLDLFQRVDPSSARNFNPWETENGLPIGAATLLLDDSLARLVDAVVLEGGPGQGKSTLSQYICQVHRMKILGRSELGSLPDLHRPRSARYPIKVDLREYAAWLAGTNPFAQDKSEPRPPRSNKSLESFVAALISDGSGGMTFEPDDLAAVVRSSAILLVLDGLDEVAEVSLRNEVVKETGAAVRRLQEAAASLQVVVTTRPSALAEVTGFPPKTFQHWTLTRLGRQLIDEYSARWTKSRRIPQKEAADLRRILSDKLDQPHMRDLARNPMQLAILLSVIHTRGSSLPDKRTALYDIYVELFLAREAEKSETVKRRQEILIDVHRYLAWVLHSEAETGRTLGKIDADRLRDMLREYLTKEGRDPGLADELFTGLAQRVVFLVGAVEGLFEFEVQPLREYFAGRYLYETAPYSPVGNPRRGTKDERFDALARNMHWQNVARFYAGCFSKGELPSLVDRLEVLCEDPDFGLTSYPRVLAATLVADWVFNQNARSLRRIINVILDEDGYKSLLKDEHYEVAASEPLTLPDGCGREELVARCLEVLKTNRHHDVRILLAQLAQRNSSSSELLQLWLKGFSSLREKERRLSWFVSGHFLGVLSSCTNELLASILSENGLHLFDETVFRTLISAGRAEFYERSHETIDGFVSRVIDGRISSVGRRSASPLDMLCLSLSPALYSQIALFDDRASLRENYQRHFGYRWGESPMRATGNPAVDSLISRFSLLADLPIGDWINADKNFEAILAELAAIRRDSWSAYAMGLAYVKISKKAPAADSRRPDLFDRGEPLLERLQNSRRQAGNFSWWINQLSGCSSDEERQIWVVVAMTICGPMTLSKLFPKLDEILSSESAEDYSRLVRSLEMIRSWGKKRRGVNMESLPKTMGARMAAVLALHSPAAEQEFLVESYLSDYQGEDEFVNEIIFYSAIGTIQSDPSDWGVALERLRRSYRFEAGPIYPGYFRGVADIPLDGARQIAADASSYPHVLVRLAEVRLRRELGVHAVPLSRVAEEDGWFED